jgi:dihydroflavonol-4-reductase
VGVTLVTGGTGFIGSHVVRALAARGDELRLLVRESSDLEPLAGMEFERVVGDVTDRGSVEKAMKGVERVFNLAASTSMRRGARQRVFDVNVGGTWHVLQAALDQGVTRVVHTSSAGAVGPAKPEGTADESQGFKGADLGIAYITAKHEAETEAMRLAERGLGVVCVNPTFVLGPDDPSGTSTGLVRRFMLRRIPFYVDGGLNIVDVRDVAQGHLLADKKGVAGERYLLAGRNFTLDRLFADLGRIAGVPPPPIKLPGQLALAAIEAAERAGLPAPTTRDEVKSGMQWWTYRNAKARKELGFSPRPHEETLEDTVAWIKETLGGKSPPWSAPVDLAFRALGRVSRVTRRFGIG